MLLDASLVGHRVAPARPYEVAREKVREFAVAIHEGSPACTDVGAASALGHPDLVAPPTFAVIPAFRGLDALVDELGIDYAGVVHGEQRFRYERPVCAGDELSTAAVVESVRTMGGGTFLGVRCELTDAAGQLVATAWSTIVVRDVAVPA